MKENKKSFDCIEYKRAVQSEIYEEIKKLKPAEEIEYFKKKSANGPFASFYKSLLKSHSKKRIAA